MKNLIIVFLFSSIYINAQLDSNPFISNTEKITTFSLEGTKWFIESTYISSSTKYFIFGQRVIQNYSEFSSGRIPTSAKYGNKEMNTNIKVNYPSRNGYPSYWRVYSSNDNKVDFLRIVNQQKAVYDFDLTNYKFDNSLGRDLIVLNGKSVTDEDYAIGESNSEFDGIDSNSWNEKIYIPRNNFSFQRVLSPQNVNLNNEIEKYVKQNIFQWQEKGEFEKTSDYNIRVTQKSRQKKIIEFEKEAMIKIGGYLTESLKLNSDKLNLGLENIKVSKYDADNETFVVAMRHFDYDIPFIIKIPIDVARKFKENLSEAILTDAEFVVIDNKAVLTFANIEFENAIYNYDNKNNYYYVETKINYNFDEIIINSKTSSSNYLNVSTNTISKGKSDVDTNIPINKKNNNRYALIIGNEDYSSYQRTLSKEQNVEYASNDASVFKNYALKTLGVKEENMHFLINATAGQMSQEIDLVSKIVSKIGSDAELIVYYAGHGYPDEINKTPYLIPVDVTASNLSRAIKLDDFYSSFSSTGASRIIVFLDACFTGGARNKSLLASRGIKVRPKSGVLKGNIVVFSASSYDQSSLPLRKEKHGIFTYHLLKKLQETKADINLLDLSEYLKAEVSLQSLKINKADQEPSVSFGALVKNKWESWKF